MMSQQRCCRKCGELLTDGAPEGLCPPYRAYPTGAETSSFVVPADGAAASLQSDPRDTTDHVSARLNQARNPTAMDMAPIWTSGRKVGWRTVTITMRQVREWACAEGFSVPTSDQWEHACRAGTRTFWWWGNGLGFPLPERNAFGLQIAWNTYRSEWGTAPDVYRGGDGGCSSCGGMGGLPTALRLASAYCEPFPDPDDQSARFSGDCRQVFPLCDG
jgi:hypothetical protein